MHPLNSNDVSPELSIEATQMYTLPFILRDTGTSFVGLQLNSWPYRTQISSPGYLNLSIQIDQISKA